MKFIIDAQLPKSLSDFLISKGFDSVHTSELPDKNRTTDKQIARIAHDENRIVISKDVDFLESYILKSSPRKLILVRVGNISNKQLIDIFDENLEVLIKLISRSNLLEVSRTEIAEHN